MPAGPAGGSADSATKLELGIGYGFFRTDVSFDGHESDAKMGAHMVVLTGTTPLSKDWSLSAILGATLGGQLVFSSSDTTHAIGQGAVVGVAFERQWLPQTASSPFLSTGFKLAASFSPSVGHANEELLAIDLRASVTVGKTLAGLLTPYLSARVFGGPIIWLRRSQTLWGTDRYHVQLALGMTLRIPVDVERAISLSLDVSPMFERSASISVNFDL